MFGAEDKICDLLYNGLIYFNANTYYMDEFLKVKFETFPYCQSYNNVFL